MNYNLLFLLLLLSAGLFPRFLNAQQRVCATHAVHNEKMTHAVYRAAFEKQFRETLEAEKSGIAGTDSSVIIPVVVHVIYNNSEQNISDEQIKSQIDILNEDHALLNSNIADVPTDWTNLTADSKIRFKLATLDSAGNPVTGITRTLTPVESFEIQDSRIKEGINGGKDAWPRNSYLNIWVCNLAHNALGYATFPNGNPSEDGIVISYKAFGRKGTVKPPYSYGRTSTHEFGHWLNLFHIWGDDGGLCNGSDQVNDTPNQGTFHYRCPSFPKTDNCTATSPGIMYMNYMDYTDDVCMSFYTQGQVTRMRNALFTQRSSLLASSGALPITLNGKEAEIDSVLIPVKNISSRCFQPVIRIRNNGNIQLTNLRFNYNIGNGLRKTYNWTGNLNPGQSEIVTLPFISSDDGDRVFEVRIEENDLNRVNNYHSAAFRMSGNADMNGCSLSPLIVYPNPAMGVRRVCIRTGFSEAEKFTAEIYNACGQLVFSKEININPGDAFTADMSTCAAGVYFIKLYGDKNSESTRFIYMPDENSVTGSPYCN